MHLTCQYNGNDLYSNHWDLCTVEDGVDDRTINCPMRAGRRRFVKQLKIPNYLPKVLCETISFQSLSIFTWSRSLKLPVRFFYCFTLGQ